MIQRSLAPSCPLTGLCLGTGGESSFPWGLALFSESHWPLPAQVCSVSVLTVGPVMGQDCRKANYKLIRKCQPSKTTLCPIKSSFLLPCAPPGELGGLGLPGDHWLPLRAPPQSPPPGWFRSFLLSAWTLEARVFVTPGFTPFLQNSVPWFTMAKAFQIAVIGI